MAENGPVTSKRSRAEMEEEDPATRSDNGL